jgi:tellurite resistance protein TerC
MAILSMPLPWPWLALAFFVFVMLAVDALLLRGRARDPSMVASAAITVFWFLVAAIFAAAIWYHRGAVQGIQFIAGYLLEWSMSLDNIFVFAVLFRYFQVPRQYQYKVLFWGILGAVVMRLAFILVGAALIEQFHFVLPLLGVFLVYTGLKFVWHSPADIDPRKNIVFRMARHWLPLAAVLASEEADINAAGEKGPVDAAAIYGRGFFVRENNRIVVTGLFLVVLVIESTDLLFAVDSVPAIFGVTRDPFIVFSSNLLAILGLRAIYFLLAGALELFRYLHFGLAAILVFVGVKMIAELLWPDMVPVWASLLVIGGLLAASIVASLQGRI